MRASDEMDFEYLVGMPLFASGLAQEGLELLVERLVAPRPVDVAVDFEEEKLEKRLESGVQDILPTFSIPSCVLLRT